MATINRKAGVLIAAATMALAIGGLSGPASAQQWERGRGNQDREARQAQQGDFRARVQEMRQQQRERVARPQPPQAQIQRERPQFERPRMERPDPQQRGDGGQWRGQNRGQDRGQWRQAPEQRQRPAWAGERRPDRPQVQAPVPPQTTQRVDRDRDRSGTPSWREGNRDNNAWRNNGTNDRWRDNDRRGDNDRWRDNDRRGDNDRWRDNDRRGDNDRWRGNSGWRNNDGWRSNERGDRYRAWNRNDWRRDNRYDWQRYRDRNRTAYRIGRYYAPYSNYSYRRLSIGFSLGSMFYGNRYWINDPWSYRLPPVYGPYRWVRYYDDVVLVDIYSGEVVDVIYDFFW